MDYLSTKVIRSEEFSKKFSKGNMKGESASGIQTPIDCRDSNITKVVIDAKTGNVTTTLPIDERVDGEPFDPKLMRAFSSNGAGTLTIVREVDPDSSVVAQNLATQPGARTVALDSATHHLFLPTAEFNPPPAATADNPRPRPTIKPDSFVVLEVGEAKQVIEEN